MQYIFIILTLCLFINTSAYATQCAYRELREHTKKMKYTFLAKVEAIKGDYVYIEIIENFGEPLEGKVKLNFQEKVRAVGDQGVARYVIEKEYLISTSNPKLNEDGGVTFRIGFCNIQEKAENVPELIEWLRKNGRK